MKVELTRDDPSRIPDSWLWPEIFAEGCDIQHHFASMGEKAVEMFTKTFELGRKEEQIRTLGELNEEISRLRQELSVAKTERQQLGALSKAARVGRS